MVLVPVNVELPIRKLQKAIFQKFNGYKWNTPEIINDCIEQSGKKQGSKLQLSNTQKFVSLFVRPENPNGFLLWHSVGAGKTLSAVSIIKQFEKHGYNSLWITRTTLRKDLQKALDMLPLSKNLTVLSYKQFSNVGKGRGEIYRRLVHRAQKINKGSYKDDPLYKTIVIIDEAHKLYTKDLKPQEMHDISSIQKMIHNSYENNRDLACKVVIMSATPITADPMEIVRLFNLIIENPDNRFNVETFKKDYLDNTGKFTDVGKIFFMDRIKDLVSYIDLSKDPRKFAGLDYNEILIPISEPEDNDNKLDIKKCKELYKLCQENGKDNTTCNNDLDVCKDNVKNIKKLYKNAKFQKVMLKEKCNITL